jgi:hypothetical protein
MVLVASAAILFALAGQASALDGLSLSGEAGGETADVAATGCPALTKIKYPFLSCQRDAQGSAVLDDQGSVVSSPGHMPEQAAFVEGNGYWGPDR